MVDNDNACFLNARGVLESIASRARSYKVSVLPPKSLKR
jgi:hypothetical protein